MRKKLLVLYVPVLHQGYISFFERQRYEVEGIYIFGSDLMEELVFLEKEIRAIDPCFMASLIFATGLFKKVEVLNKAKLLELNGQDIVTADESISRRLIERYFKGSNVEYDTVFLRWDESHVAIQQPVESFTVSDGTFDKNMMQLARSEGFKSSDWWRQVGSILVRGEEIILTSYNRHLPSELSPYIFGDIRDFIRAGENSDISSSLHSEKVLISTAARKGISLEGASLYVSTFPCSDCANWVALSGIKKCFFGGGHASFQGEKVLKSFGVELIYVK